jgi:acyl carrier protein
MSNNQIITQEILNFLYENFPLALENKPLPMNSSLYEAGILDSVGIVELVDFLETRYDIKIKNEDITLEKFGSVNKMVNLTLLKKGD